MQIEQYYSDTAIVFSGKNGFHIHVLVFNLREWTRYDKRNPIKSQEVAMFKFTKTISLETYCFDRAHFTVSTDLMKVITVPSRLYAESGLVCTYIGERRDLELQTTENIVVKANPIRENFAPASELHGYPEPIGCEKTHKTGWGKHSKGNCDYSPTKINATKTQNEVF